LQAKSVQAISGVFWLKKDIFSISKDYAG